MIPPGVAQKSNNVSLKCIVLGDSKVGKTALCERYVNRVWNDQTAPTISAACYSKDIIMNTSDIKFYIWDTAGQEQFRSISPIYYRSCHVAILVFDLTSLSSLEVANYWVKELRANGPQSVPIITLGNKKDLEMFRQVAKTDCQQFAESLNAIYFEVSALTGENVEEAFQRAAEAALEYLHKEEVPVAHVEDSNQDKDKINQQTQSEGCQC